jgi:hypothetical protein
MVSHTLNGDYDELNMIPAVRLMEVVLQNCPGKVSLSVTCYVTVLVTLESVLCVQCDQQGWWCCAPL